MTGGGGEGQGCHARGLESTRRSNGVWVAPPPRGERTGDLWQLCLNSNVRDTRGIEEDEEIKGMGQKRGEEGKGSGGGGGTKRIIRGKTTLFFIERERETRTHTRVCVGGGRANQLEHGENELHDGSL